MLVMDMRVFESVRRGQDEALTFTSVDAASAKVHYSQLGHRQPATESWPFTNRVRHEHRPDERDLTQLGARTSTPYAAGTGLTRTHRLNPLPLSKLAALELAHYASPSWFGC